MKRNDMFIGVYLMAAVIFFIIPMPSLLLDILIALNLSVSLIILFLSLFGVFFLNYRYSHVFFAMQFSENTHWEI